MAESQGFLPSYLLTFLASYTRHSSLHLWGHHSIVSWQLLSGCQLPVSCQQPETNNWQTILTEERE